jgi:fermentation-respiration switch protein FrsA (DUF1100 family)
MVSIARRKPLTIVGIVAMLVIALVVLLIALLTVFQERIAFQPQGPPYPTVEGAHRVDYAATDGQPLFAYVVGVPAADKPLLIVFHGNADMAVLQLDWAEEILRRTGVPVMIAEYRGYAGLTGKPAYQGSQLDADAAYAFAEKTLHVQPGRIAFFGHSLGSAIAAELAARHPPFVLILQSPFTSARDMAKSVLGHRPRRVSWNLFSRIHFDTIERVKHLDAPVSVAHGGRDRLIPMIMGKAVFDSAKVKGEWLLVPNASHNDVSIRGGDAYWQWMTLSLSLHSTTSAQRKAGS